MPQLLIALFHCDFIPGNIKIDSDNSSENVKVERISSRFVFSIMCLPGGMLLRPASDGEPAIQFPGIARCLNVYVKAKLAHQ